MALLTACSALGAFTTIVCLVVYAGLIRLAQKGSMREYAKDPVRDLMVDVATAKLTSNYHRETVYFCAPSCERAFDRDPERYLVHSLRQSKLPADPRMPP